MLWESALTVPWQAGLASRSLLHQVTTFFMSRIEWEQRAILESAQEGVLLLDSWCCYSRPWQGVWYLGALGYGPCLCWMVFVGSNCDTGVISYFKLSLPLQYWTSSLGCWLLGVVENGWEYSLCSPLVYLDVHSPSLMFCSVLAHPSTAFLIFPMTTGVTRH